MMQETHAVQNEAARHVTLDALGAAKEAARAGLDKKAEDVLILDLAALSSYTEAFVLLTGASDRQVVAIAEGVEERLRELGLRPIGVEGYARGQWVLLDYGDLVVHVFYDGVREFYDLEGLWADARRVRIG
jgi:ribosome-associated protein